MDRLVRTRPETRAIPWIARVAIAVAALLLAATGAVFATQGTGVTSTNLSIGRFDAIHVATHVDAHKVFLRTKGTSDVYVVSNVIAPGGHTGWHTHPGPSLITVKSGTITVYSPDSGCVPTDYPAGTGFIDPGDGHVHILRNEGTVVAETIAVQLLPAGAARRIDASTPAGCPL